MDRITTEGFTVEQINKAIEVMSRCQSGAITSIARVMVMAAWASITNSDAGVANALLKNLRKGVKKTAIVGVLEGVANLAYVSGTFVFFDAKKVYDTDGAAVIKAKCAAWESFKSTTEPVTVDAAEALASLVDKLTKADGKGLLTHANILARITQLSAEISGELVFEVGSAT